MTRAEARIKAAIAAGDPITPSMTVATITSATEMDAYRRVLSENGGLTAEAMAAIRDRQDELRRGKP